MALLSEDRVSLFNESLIQLIKFLIEKKWTSSDRTANFGAFIIDKMHFELDPISRPYDDLCLLFQRLRKDKEIEEEFRETDGSLNFMR